MNKKIKSALSIIVTLLPACALFYILFLNHSTLIDNTDYVDPKDLCTSTTDQENKSSENAEIIIKDLILKEIEKHKGLQVIINAHEGKIIHTDDKIQCKAIHCSLCNQNKQIANLMASDAIINKSTKNIFLNGDTIVHFDDITINSKEVYYNYSDQLLSTSKPTAYDHPNFKLEAEYSTIDFKKNEIQMSGGVHSVFLNCPAEDNNCD